MCRKKITDSEIASIRKQWMRNRKAMLWLAQFAANNGWHGYRVSADDMLKMALDEANFLQEEQKNVR